MKKLICAIISGMILMAGTAYADITVKIDGDDLVTDVAPINQNDRVFVPMRAIFEKLGCNVEWLEADRLILSTRNKEIMLMQIGSKNISYVDLESNKKNIFTMDVEPFIKDDRTLVPIRAVSETLGCNVDWDGTTQTVIISTKAK